MRYVFFGSPEFAAIILRKLIEGGCPPALVITNPDRLLGRKRVLTSPPAKLVAEEHGVKVFQPEKLSPSDLAESDGYDFFIVAAYSKIIPSSIIDLPRIGTIGVHPSLLPKFRGPSPIQYAILQGEEITGTTLFLIDEKIDHGPVIAQKTGIRIDNKYFGELTRDLAEASAELLLENWPRIVANNLKPLPQNESLATLTYKIQTDDGYVPEDELNRALQGKSAEDANKINRMVRAFNPEPGVYSLISGKRMKILKSHTENGRLFPEIIQREGGKPVVVRL
ncbi:MAG: methionyl-tRNA formyltransferase [Patescibacteria group bacterium]|nr:methionyl-tRNA formyltransferase [Patescibacteria group bacterium]